MVALPTVLPPSSGLNPETYRTIRLSRLKRGAKLQFPIRDERDVLLLAGDQVITSGFLELLKQRGVVSVRVHQSEVTRICRAEPQGTATVAMPSRAGMVCPLRNDATERLDRLACGGQLGLAPQADALVHALQPHGAAAYDDQLKDQFGERQDQGVNRIKDVFQALAGRGRLDADALSTVIDDAITDLTQDMDLFACLGINPFADDYPARHSLHVCMLALVIGTELRLSRQTLKELAAGCLIHDAGMLKIDRKDYWTDKILSKVEFLEIMKHPVYTFDMIKDLRAVSSISALIAYQTHERCDGSGYPRRRAARQIHPLSKIAAVADAYVGLVSPRPYRPAVLPYCAMERMLSGVRDGLFDSAVVRALLQCLSLFPLGSYVQLSDGRVGRVIRRNEDAYTAPIIEAWQRDNQGHEGDHAVVNLLEVSERVVGVLPNLEAAA